jgi:hypothetical protein
MLPEPLAPPWQHGAAALATRCRHPRWPRRLAACPHPGPPAAGREALPAVTRRVHNGGAQHLPGCRKLVFGNLVHRWIGAVLTRRLHGRRPGECARRTLHGPGLARRLQGPHTPLGALDHGAQSRHAGCEACTPRCAQWPTAKAGRHAGRRAPAAPPPWQWQCLLVLLDQPLHGGLRAIVPLQPPMCHGSPGSFDSAILPVQSARRPPADANPWRRPKLEAAAAMHACPLRLVQVSRTSLTLGTDRCLGPKSRDTLTS